jgi:hypothetical protein
MAKNVWERSNEEKEEWKGLIAKLKCCGGSYLVN